MNEYQVLGIKSVNFVNDQGEVIAGKQLWLSGTVGDSSWLEGIEVFKSWVKEGSNLDLKVTSLHVGDIISCVTDRKGRVTDIEV